MTMSARYVKEFTGYTPRNLSNAVEECIAMTRYRALVRQRILIRQNIREAIPVERLG